MNILLESINFYPVPGGIQIYLENIAKKFMKKGHNVTVLCRNPGDLPKQEEHKGIKIIRYTPSNAKESRLEQEQETIKEGLKNLNPSPEIIIQRAVIFTNPNKEIFPQAETIYIAPSTSYFLKEILQKHKELTKEQEESFKINIEMEEETLKTSKRIVAASENVKSQISQAYNISPEKIKVINPGFDSEKFTPSELKNKIALTVCRLSQEKNVQALIKAFKDVKEGTLTIVGDGPERESLQKLVEELNLQEKITFTGQTDKPEEYYKQASVFILPSVYEGFGLVLLEAMASALPCIAFSPDKKKILTASNEIIKESKTGFLVKDEKELAEKINQLFLNENQLQEMSSNAIKEAKKYSWKTTSDELLKFANS